MDEKSCFSCGRFPAETRGMFLDFDADPRQEGGGIPLCPSCVGTGVVLSTHEFDDLQKEVSLIRKDSLFIQCKAGKEITIFEMGEVLSANNRRLREIASEALALVKNPAKGCYAIALCKR